MGIYGRRSRIVPINRRPSMLRYRQDVAVGIFEPGHFGAARSRPDAPLLVLHERVSFKSYAALDKPFDHCLDIADFPAENGVLGRSEVSDLHDADLMIAGSHHQRELVETHKLKPEFTFVKCAG